MLCLIVYMLTATHIFERRDRSFPSQPCDMCSSTNPGESPHLCAADLEQRKANGLIGFRTLRKDAQLRV